jgi:hypothetical protein
MDLSRLNLMMASMREAHQLSEPNSFCFLSSSTAASSPPAERTTAQAAKPAALLAPEPGSSIPRIIHMQQSRFMTCAQVDADRPPLRLLQQSGLQHRQPSPSLSH